MMKLTKGRIRRSDFVWLTMWVACLMTLTFGIVENYLAALICTLYMLLIAVANLIYEQRRINRRKQREDACKDDD